jgi:hypothetical protein
MLDNVRNGLLEYKNYSALLSDFNRLQGMNNIAYDISSISSTLGDIATFGFDYLTADPVTGTLTTGLKYVKNFSKLMKFGSLPFKESAKSLTPPFLIEAQMSIVGKLESTTAFNGFDFDMFTPGTYRTSFDVNTLNNLGNLDRFEYPTYNQPLGLYALLKTPTKDVASANATETTIKLVSVKNIYDNWGWHIGTSPLDSVSNSFAFSPREAFKLNHDLSFTFNPSAQINFEETKMEAAWMVEVQNFDHNNFWLFTSMNMTPTYSYQNENNQTITVFSSEFMPIECISQFAAVFDFALNENALRTEKLNYFPNNPIPTHLQSLLDNHKNNIIRSRPKIVNTFLKLNITYRYNKPDMSGLNDIVNFETYKYEIEGNTSNPSILELSNIVDLSAPSELIIENKTYSGNETIFAWDKITLKGFINTTSGTNVTIKSAGEIVIDPSAVIGPEITLLIGTPSQCNPVRIQPRVIDATYCNNATQYKGNTSLAKKGNDLLPTAKVETTNYTIIYPNPTATGNFVVETTLEKESFVNFFIYDIAGKLLYQHQSKNNLGKGKHKQEINNVLFQNGLYIVEVETNQGKKTYKLIRN